MIERLDLSCYPIGGILYLIPNSFAPDGSVVFELPPEQCRLDASDEILGSSIIRAANRCREGNNLVGSNSDSVAKALGFKSNADIRKKIVPIVISRRNGSLSLSIAPMRRQKSQVVFTDTEFEALISNLAEIGRLAKEAIEISSA